MTTFENSDTKGDRAKRKVCKVLKELERMRVIESFG